MNIQKIEESYTIIQNTIENNFVNPPVSQITWLDLWNNTNTTAFINGGAFPNPWRMCLTTGNFSGQFEGLISNVFSPNTSTPSYIDVSKTAKYRVNIIYSNLISGSPIVNSFFNVLFWDITSDSYVAFASIDFWNSNGPTLPNAVINGIFTLQSGHQYDVRLQTPQNDTRFTQVYQLSINIEEFVSLYA